MKIYKSNGFTLIELMIALVIIIILTLASVAVYTKYIYESRRSDATTTLASISLAEERYRTSNSSYGTLAQVWNNASTTQGGYYTLSISNVSGTAYTITATAIGNQSKDTENGVSCATLTLTLVNGSFTKSPSACWPP